MKLLFSFLLIMIGYSSNSTAAIVNRDSLINLAKTTTDIDLQAETYRNLADIYLEKPQEKQYLQLLYQTAHKVKNHEMAMDAMSDLAYAYMVSGDIDSVYHCIDIIKKEAVSQEKERYLAYIHMRLFNKQKNRGKKEREAVFKYEMDYLQTADKNSIYVQIEQEYIIGSSLFYENKDKEAHPHLESAFNLAKTLTGKDAFKILAFAGWLYANNSNGGVSTKRCIELTEFFLSEHKADYKKNYEKTRPFYPINRQYLQCYASLMLLADSMPKEKTHQYFKEVMKLSTQVREPFDRYNCNLAISLYYLYLKDYRHALQYNDSLIKIAKAIAATMVPSLYQLESKYYSDMKDFENALKSHQLYTHLKDSLASQDAQNQLNTLQVEYQVDKLEFEKTELENKNKRVQVITLSVILILAIIACIYFYHHWKMEKQMKLNLFKLNQKAEESEKMKTEFLNSMCHEIRTPLNAIVGFSGIVVDDAFDSESKKEFCELIVTNTALLTSLIDHLLVVANLDSSNEVLPCQITNLNDICQEEINKALSQNKKGLEYRLELPKEDIIAHTSAKYLALVIENLLSNAYKFTQQGQITLSLQRDDDARNILFEVTDTGCGIPADKHEIIFERFTKLDSFTQGNGLGLFLSKLIITRLMGKIYIDPTYTNGTRFVLSLPAQINDEENTQPKQP